jgi:hypothetical protein
MTVALGAVTLSDDLRLTGFRNQPLVAGNTRMTLGGRPVLQGIPLSGGRQLVLEAFRDGDGIYGHFTGTQLAAIATLRDAMTEVTLTHHLGAFQVVVLALDVTPVVDVADPAAAAEYHGTITMIEV